MCAFIPARTSSARVLQVAISRLSRPATHREKMRASTLFSSLALVSVLSLEAPSPGAILRRQQRWDAAVTTLEATTNARRRFDHRAHLARLVGLYVSTQTPGAAGSEAELLVAMQPDQGGRKLLFLHPVHGRTLGFLELETPTAVSGTAATGTAISALRGMLVDESCRGKGYARLFLAIWLSLCSAAGVTPATARINKVTRMRLGHRARALGSSALPCSRSSRALSPLVRVYLL